MFSSLTSARALLLVNTDNSYELEEQFRLKSEGSCLPAIVVTKTTGEELLGLLREHGRDVEVKVHRGVTLDERVGDEWEVIPSPSPRGMHITVEPL